MVDFAYAAAQMPNGGGSGAVMTQVLFFAAIFAIFYFLLIRPQQRQRRERDVVMVRIGARRQQARAGGRARVPLRRCHQDRWLMHPRQRVAAVIVERGHQTARDPFPTLQFVRPRDGRKRVDDDAI